MTVNDRSWCGEFLICRCFISELQRLLVCSQKPKRNLVNSASPKVCVFWIAPFPSFPRARRLGGLILKLNNRRPRRPQNRSPDSGRPGASQHGMRGAREWKKLVFLERPRNSFKIVIGTNSETPPFVFPWVCCYLRWQRKVFGLSGPPTVIKGGRRTHFNEREHWFSLVVPPCLPGCLLCTPWAQTKGQVSYLNHLIHSVINSRGSQ